MVYKSRKSRKKIKTRKKYKGGNPPVESVDDMITLINKKSKGNPLTGSRNWITFLSRQLYSTHYNVKLLKAIKSSYTFSTNGYFIDTILSFCNNDINMRNNYYALCVLIRLFYSKNIAKSYSYFTLQQNIIDNCITIHNIQKQKDLIDSSIKTKNNNDLTLILKKSNFYKILQDIMNNSDPIKKLKSMEQSGVSYKIYSTIPILNTEFLKNTNIETRTKTTPTTTLSDEEKDALNRFKTSQTSRDSLDKVRKEILKIPIKSTINSVTTQAKKEGQYIVKSGQDIVKSGKDIYKKYLQGDGRGYTNPDIPIIETVSTQSSPVSAQPPPAPSDTGDILEYYQNLIEQKFKVDKNNYSYIILFVLNNILNKIHQLKYVHNDIPFINNDSFCDNFYKILETEYLKKNRSICGDEKTINVLLT